jgi:hypothetical protein
VKAILGDYNLQGHTRLLVGLWEQEPWRLFWKSLALQLHTFPQLGLSPQTPDNEIWRLCQREQIVLLTANRNQDGPDSLEAVIRAENQPDSLPVFTISNADRLFVSRDYATRVAERLLEYLLYIDNVRGSGRLFVP